MNSNKNIIAYLALAAICIIWGTTYLVLRIGVTHFPPFLFSMLRFLIAAPVLLLAVFISGRVAMPDSKTILNQAISGFLMITLGISMVGWAEVYISSGVAAVICSMMPIWTILINLAANRDDQPNWIIVVGLATGMTGILLIFSEHLAEFAQPNYQFGIVVTFLANLSWAFGSIWVKKTNQNTNPFLAAGLQMLFGGIFLIPLSLVFDDYQQITWTNEVVYALLYMAAVGSIAAYVCYSYAIKKLPMTLVSLYAYVNPVVAVILGWLILQEKLNMLIAIAIVITVAGIYIVNKGYQLKTLWKDRALKS